MTNRNTNQVMIRNIFNTDVNIADYDTLHSAFTKEKQLNATFVKFTWIDISSKTKDDEDLQNLGIRDAQNDRLEGMQNLKISISRGWNTSFFPPCYGTDGRFRDGRGRVISAIENREQWMVVALYDYNDADSPLRNYMTNGLIANSDHNAAELSKMKDYIEAGVSLILARELPNDRNSITDWLYNECLIERRFPGNIGGHITKITDGIIARAKEGLNGATIRKKDDKEWLDWLDKSLTKNALHWQSEYGISDMIDIVFYKNGRGAAERVLTRYILENAARGVVTKIILYANGTRDEMIKDHIAFEEAMREFYDNTYKWINHEIRGIELKHETDSPMWKIVGVIPQFLNDDKHDAYYKKGYLIPMSDIRKLHPINNVLPFAA